MSSPAASELRELWSHVPASVAVLSTLCDGAPYGTTATAVLPLSLDPPLVLAALLRDSRLLAMLRESAVLGISYLAAEQTDVARALAQKVKDMDAIEWAELDGIPYVRHSRLVVVAEVSELRTYGDHDLVVGAIRGAELLDGASHPVLYSRRGYGLLQGELPNPAG
ncbi:MAG: flavin reductase [Actinobacteria bacterium]|nr:flavin reductase [Actinomycetota bacterium]